VPPEHPAPLIPARPIEWLITRKKSGKDKGGIKAILGDVEMPESALTFAKAMHDLPGWTFLASYSVGWDMNADGTTKVQQIKEPTGEYTDKGNARTKKVGERDRPAVPSVLLRVIAKRQGRLCVLAGFWIDGTFDHGMVMIPPGLAGLRVIKATPFAAWRDDLHNVDVDRADPGPVLF
jgi:hypothetical protein